MLKSYKLFFIPYHLGLFHPPKNTFLIVSDTFWGPKLSKDFGGPSPWTLLGEKIFSFHETFFSYSHA